MMAAYTHIFKELALKFLYIYSFMRGPIQEYVRQYAASSL